MITITKYVKEELMQRIQLMTIKSVGISKWQDAGIFTICTMNSAIFSLLFDWYNVLVHSLIYVYILKKH